MANATRGEREITLGTLGKLTLRPSLRALEWLDNPATGGPLSARVERFAHGQSLTDTVDVVYQTHIDGLPPGDERLSRESIGEAILGVGMQTFRSDCFFLLYSAWGDPEEIEPEVESETTPGK